MTRVSTVGARSASISAVQARRERRRASPIRRTAAAIASCSRATKAIAGSADTPATPARAARRASAPVKQVGKRAAMAASTRPPIRITAALAGVRASRKSFAPSPRAARRAPPARRPAGAPAWTSTPRSSTAAHVTTPAPQARFAMREVVSARAVKSAAEPAASLRAVAESAVLEERAAPEVRPVARRVAVVRLRERRVPADLQDRAAAVEAADRQGSRSSTISRT